ncbi:MAG: class 1 fructose-bisphosphatase [Pseudomonadota bacterium]|nr:class 1 fructose-bisphosphatase [Pseudomonadota bacterium]
MSRTTLQAYLAAAQTERPTLTTELSQIVQQITTACQQISVALQQGALAGILGSADSDNIQGEVQKKLDVIADDLLVDALTHGGLTAAIASEEQDHMVLTNATGQYLVLFDPLDGSSNIDVNMSVGTIFSILQRPNPDSLSTTDFFQAGQNQVAAGYVLYGPSTLLVLTLGAGVDVFTLDPQTGEFILTVQQLQIPADTQEFAINMSNQRHWEIPVKQYIDECLAGKTGSRDKDFNMRWVASMVGDVHRILTRGGIFMYPYDFKDPTKAGRLRLMYEANPMSLLIEQAGGAATTGRMRILEVQPNDLHQRIPVVLGSRHEVERVTQYHLQHDQAQG